MAASSAPRLSVDTPPAAHATSTGSAAAFFDLDNTLIQGASLFHLARGLAAHRFLTSRQIARLGCSQIAFRVRGERDNQLESTRSRALAFAKGHTVAEIVEISQEIFEKYLAGKIWPGTHDLALDHLDRGEPVWLVTAAPKELAEVIAERLGLTGALGTVAESVNGVYTGRLSGQMLHGAAKSEAVLTLATREGYRLADCYAYSDSANDLPMLTLVGHPHAVNPDHRLRRRARELDWPMVDFRAGTRLLRLGLPGAAAAGATAGAVTAGAAIRRRNNRD
jgi:HAD superfamily hydrolase (TIGR01490 family)